MAKFLKISCILFLVLALASELISLSCGTLAQSKLRCGPIDALILHQYNLPDARSAFKICTDESRTSCERNICDMVFYHEVAKWFFALAFFSLFSLIAHRMKGSAKNIVQCDSVSTRNRETKRESTFRIWWNINKQGIIVISIIILGAIIAVWNLLR